MGRLSRSRVPPSPALQSRQSMCHLKITMPALRLIYKIQIKGKKLRDVHRVITFLSRQEIKEAVSKKAFACYDLNLGSHSGLLRIVFRVGKPLRLHNSAASSLTHALNLRQYRATASGCLARLELGQFLFLLIIGDLHTPRDRRSLTDTL